MQTKRLVVCTAVSVFLVAVFVLTRPLPGNVVVAVSKTKAALGISLALVLLSAMTRIRVLPLLVGIITLNWWMFGLATWAVPFMLMLAVWLIWLVVLEAVPKNYEYIVGLALLSAGLVQVFFMVLQTYGLDPIMKPIDVNGMLQKGNITYAVGLFGNPSDCGIFLALLLPMIFALGKYCREAVGAIFLVGIVLSKSTVAFGIALVMLSAYIIYMFWDRKIYLVFAPLPFMALPFWFKFDPIINGAGRFKVWEQAYATLLQYSPIFGFGPGAMGTKWMFKAQNILWRMLQNEYLEFTFNFGFVGLAALLIAIIYIVYKAFKSDAHIYVLLGLLAVGLCSLASIPFHLMPTALVATWYLSRVNQPKAT